MVIQQLAGQQHESMEFVRKLDLEVPLEFDTF